MTTAYHEIDTCEFFLVLVQYALSFRASLYILAAMQAIFTSEKEGRLDQILSARLQEVSRATIQKTIKQGFVQVNGDVCTKSSAKISIGDRIEFEPLSEDATQNDHSIFPVDLQLPVLYQDDDCLVIAKPAGISVHPGHSSEENEITILHGVAYIFEQLSVPFSPDATLVHRLDKDTTGCMLIAKTPKAHLYLQKQFEERAVQKQYLALVEGVPKNYKAIIDAPLGRNLTDRTKMSVVMTSTSKPAKTGYEILEASDNVALLRCDLFTGRTHQIRVHLASIGHSILGDETYGSPSSKRFSQVSHINSICLHAWKLEFLDMQQNPVQIEAPLVPEFLQSLKNVSISFS